MDVCLDMFNVEGGAGDTFYTGNTPFPLNSKYFLWQMGKAMGRRPLVLSL